MNSGTPLPGRPVRGSHTGRPVMALLDLLGRRGTLRVLWELHEGHGQSFRLLRANADGISPSVLNDRLKELRESDSDVALRHVWAHKGDYFADSATRFEDMAQRIYELVSRRLPADLAVRMLLKPMLLPPRVEGLVRTPISRLATRVMSY